MQTDTGKCILIIDDDPIALRIMQMLLQSAGYQLLSATNALDAIRLLEGGARPDLIISDIMMPGMLGTELVGHLATQPDWARIPVILVSAYHDHAYDCTVAAFVPKPVELPALLTLVSGLLAEPSPP